MVLEAHVVLCVTKPDLKKKCPKNVENGAKIVVFLDLLENLVIIFFLRFLFQNKNLFYFLYSCTNLILGKNLVAEIWGKMLSANQIAEFLNQLYL